MKIIAFLFCLFFGFSLPLQAQYNYRLEYGFVDKDQPSADISRTVEVLKYRIRQITSDFDVSIDGDNRILVNIKSSYNHRRLNSLLINQGKLEFWEVFKVEELAPFLDLTNEFLKKENKSGDNTNPLLDIVSGPEYKGSPILFYTKIKDTANVNSFLKQPKIKSLLTEKFKYVKFLWGVYEGDSILPLYAAKSNEKDSAFITGAHILEATQDVNVIGRPSVMMEMNADGAKRWERMTENAFKNQSQIAITINDEVYSAPGVTSGPIRGGHCEISGNFSVKEAQDLAIILKSAQTLPKLKLLKYSIID